MEIFTQQLFPFVFFVWIVSFIGVIVCRELTINKKTKTREAYEFGLATGVSYTLFLPSSVVVSWKLFVYLVLLAIKAV